MSAEGDHAQSDLQELFSAATGPESAMSPDDQLDISEEHGSMSQIRESSSTSIDHGGDFGVVYMNAASLSDNEKYRLLTKPFVPSDTFQFPGTTDHCGKNRHFQISWLTTFPGLVYSPSMNGGFCNYCVLVVYIYIVPTHVYCFLEHFAESVRNFPTHSVLHRK